MRKKIKNLATRLLIQRGYQGFSFGDIAERLGTTRANIHYHFGNKSRLVEEVIEDYASQTLAKLQRIWLDEATSLASKIDQTSEFNKRTYARYNRGARGGKSWSLITRMRWDRDFLTPKSERTLKDFSDQLHCSVLTAVKKAQQDGEIVRGAPLEDISLLVASIISSAGFTTQDAASFQRLEQLYATVSHIIESAYGVKDKKDPAGGNVRRLKLSG